MNIIEATRDQKYEVDFFYRKVGYHGSWSTDERAFCLIDGNRIRGCVKIESINNFRVLRGMYLDDDIKNQGYGSKLLKAIEPVLDKGTAFCLPFSHLGAFYGQVGFRKIATSLLPDLLQDRVHKYSKQNFKVIAMRRNQ